MLGLEADASDAAPISGDRSATWVLRDRHRLRTGGWQHHLRKDLSGLVDLVSDSPAPVYLVGGLGLAVQRSQFHRNHADIDLAVFTDHASDLLAHFAEQGYRLAVAAGSIVISPWHRLDRVRQIDPADLLAQLTAPLRLLRASSGFGQGRSRLDLLDLLPMTRTGDHIHMHGYGRNVHVESFLPASSLAGCAPLLVPKPAYKHLLPHRWPRQRRDLAMTGLASNSDPVSTSSAASSLVVTRPI